VTAGLELAGLALYVAGIGLMAWALLTLKRTYQLGGSDPRPADHMVLYGPYRFIRHPMYTAALSISLGLALLLQSLAFFAVFGIYLMLILALIPEEENGLQRAYRDEYRSYQKHVRKLIPFFY
jgi:protein-S-isoprenylcysteine O-methyltransferase Ste14